MRGMRAAVAMSGGDRRVSVKSIPPRVMPASRPITTVAINRRDRPTWREEREGKENIYIYTHLKLAILGALGLAWNLHFLGLLRVKRSLTRVFDLASIELPVCTMP